VQEREKEDGKEKDKEVVKEKVEGRANVEVKRIVKKICLW
jgi:hypothetical protein